MTPVYPCVYRELSRTVNLALFAIGLSLCIQGTLVNLSGERRKIRFIPVYTGNSLKFSSLQKLSVVYPCVYRELN